MENLVIHGVTVTADPSLTTAEITALVEEEIKLWQGKNKTLGRLELTLDGDSIVVRAVEKSPIRRVRRITGYLSALENFNDAKRAECEARVTHC